jgi:hypothetical protein
MNRGRGSEARIHATLPRTALECMVTEDLGCDDIVLIKELKR